MAKINWEISREGYGVQYEIVASTRSDAILKAGAQYLSDTDYEVELVGSANDDGTLFVRSPIPEFKAKKLGNS